MISKDFLSTSDLSILGTNKKVISTVKIPRKPIILYAYLQP